jgi:serine O-acetyltransferase
MERTGPMPVSGQSAIPTFAALRVHWREDYAANGRRVLEPGFQALAVYRFGVWVDGIAPRLLRGPLRRLYFFLNAFVEIVYGIRLYYTVEIGRRLHLAHGQCGLVIAPYCRIGDDCVLRQNVTLGRRGDGTPQEAVPRLGDRVEIGAGAVLIGPISVGDDVLIGPNVVVREDVPPASVVMPETPRVRPRRRGRRPRSRPAPALRSVV